MVRALAQGSRIEAVGGDARASLVSLLRALSTRRIRLAANGLPFLLLVLLQLH